MSELPTKILLIDDEPEALEILELYLLKSKNNFQLIKSTNGRDALIKLAENPDISLILLDAMMPKMNGFEFMKILKKYHGLKIIPVIMQTALNGSNHLTERVRSEVDYCLVKTDFNQEKLLTYVNKAIERFNHRKKSIEQNFANFIRLN